MPGVIFVNPGSGSKSTGLEAVTEAFPDHVVQECDPAELSSMVKAAARTGADFVGVAGGDGTICTAAQELRGTDMALLAVPAGTRNHFAKDLGIASFEDAQTAVASGARRRIDIGEVNGRCFINNSSIGLYPKIVIRREARQQRLPKGVANVVAVYEQLRAGRRFRIAVDDREYWAWMVFIGNGRYGVGLLDLTDREAMDDGVLDVRVVRADQPGARIRVLLALLLGRLAASPLLERSTGSAVRLDVRKRKVDVAFDGEVARMVPPLRYQCVARALTVLVPTGSPP